MSNLNYLGYFGNKKCCNLNTVGEQGATGPQGVSGFRGTVGPTGPQGIIGPTGASCTGPTGPVGQGKTFIIQHPSDENKFLVHACLEGPEAGVYYRGKGTIENDECITITLPNYVCKISYEFTVELTPINSNGLNLIYETSEIENNKFTVYGKNGSFFWTVYGKKNEILVEPDVANVNIQGDGPYKWHY
jgi:hypothetical protein